MRSLDQGVSHISHDRRAQTRTAVPGWKESAAADTPLLRHCARGAVFLPVSGKILLSACLSLSPRPLLIILKTAQAHIFLCGEVCAYYRTHAAAIRQPEVTGPHDGLTSTASPRQHGTEPSQSERPGPRGGNLGRSAT